MTDSSEPSQVLIVGAGPAGAALAHLLATRGIAVTLLERQSDFAREFRGEVLTPSGVDVLDALGLGTALGRVPQATPTSMTAYLKREPILEVPFAPESFEGNPPRIFSQPALLEAIVSDALQKSPRLRFLRGASVKELLHENGRVVGVRARTEKGEEKLLADLVVGCDGRASVVRRGAGIVVDSEELPMDIVWCKLPVPESFGDDRPAFFSIGDGHLFIAYVAYDRLLQVAWVILKGEYGELRRQPVDRWVGEMADHAPRHLSAHLRDNAERFVHPFLLDTAADRVRSWWTPGAMVLGDAAHTMSPVGGQGLNIALRDAVVAANHLVPVLAAGGAPSQINDAARRIEAERLPEVKTIQRMQSIPPRFILKRTWWAEALRQVPKLLRFAPVRTLAAHNARPFLYGTTDVTLQV